MADALTNAQPERVRGYVSGDVIAEKYRLEGILGEGGQACVWQARNLMLEVDVAIKVVRADNEDPAHTARLLQEARSAARLDHPAIVRVFDLGRTPTGDFYLVMELLDGGTLADRLYERGRPLEPVEAVRILLPVADALVAAHSKGLVHRDLKPSNVLLARTSASGLQPKLLDFGLVKLQGRELEPGSCPLTETGAVIGTPAYFSPEQARGDRDIDESTDIWAYSAMLYECLTGRRPFDAANYNALLRSILEENPPSILDLGVNEVELWEILKRGLSKSKSERWPSMFALGSALATWLLDRGVVDDICRTSLRSTWTSAERAAPKPARADSVGQGELAVPISIEAPPSAAVRVEGDGNPGPDPAPAASSLPALPMKGTRSVRLGVAASAAVVVSAAVVWWSLSARSAPANRVGVSAIAPHSGSAPVSLDGAGAASIRGGAERAGEASIRSGAERAGEESSRSGSAPAEEATTRGGPEPAEEATTAGASKTLPPSSVVPLAPLPIGGSAGAWPPVAAPERTTSERKKAVAPRTKPEPSSLRPARSAGDDLDLLAPY